MKAHHKASCLFLVLTAVLSGCTTTLSGQRADSDRNGIRYSLPAPHIFLNPQPDGTVVVEVKYLPDPQNTYSLNLSSYLSTATFKVDIVDGMLKQVSLNSDSSKIPAESIAAATALQKARMTAAEKAAETKKKEADAEKAAIIAAADLAMQQKEKIALLEAKLDFAQNNPRTLKENEILALRLEISQQQVVLTQLQARQISAQSGPNNDTEQSNAFMEPYRSDPELKEAYGPVLFRVLPHEENGIKLVAIHPQGKYATSSAAIPPPLNIRPDKVVVDVGGEQQPIQLNALGSIEIVTKRLFQPSRGVTTPVLEGDKIDLRQLGEGGSQLELRLPADLPKGAYRLDINIQVKGEHTERAVSIEIDWLLNIP